MRFLLSAILLFSSIHGLAAKGEAEIKGLAWPALSHDGKLLAFEWLNDIWIAPSEGGEAERIVKDPAREAYPKFTPDGERLVFSSERSGSAQILSVKTDGSDLKTHTAHTEGNILEAISPDGSVALARGERGSAGYKPSRLVKVDLEKDSRELLLFDATAHSASISPDGKRFLFCRGGEQLYRKGYKGSRASSIHLYDSTDGSFKILVDGKGEAKSPLWRPDGKSFYYVSSSDGTFNVWLGNTDDSEPRQLTFFKDDGVILPVLSGDGKTMVFRCGQEVWKFHPEENAKPEIVSFFTNEKLPDRSVRKEKVSGTSYVTLSPELDRIIFSSAGDLWTMLQGDAEPSRLTSTDDIDEREPVFSPDGSKLFFLSDDGLRVDVWIVDWDGGKLGKVKIVSGRPLSKRSLRVSPDGRHLSWLEATGDLVTASVDGSDAKVVMNGWDMPTYDWSPDGEWLVAAAKDINANRDIFLVAADGSKPPFNITLHPAFDGSPKWSPDGKCIVFVSRREVDELARLMIAKVDKLPAAADATPDELAAVSDSIQPLDTDVSEPIRVAWAGDSSAVLYQSRDTGDNTVYSVPLDGGEVVEYAGFRGIPAGSGAGNSFWRIDRVPSVLTPEGLEEFRFSFSVEQDRKQRLRLGFRRIWRTLKERFYDETMNGRDWDAVLEKYGEAAVGAMDSRQFDRVVAQMLGELNASHLTFKTRPWGVSSSGKKTSKPTAHPGLEFQNSWDGPLVISSVLEGSPVSLVGNPPISGERVLRIAGKDVDARTPLTGIFNGAAKRPLPMVVADKEGRERTLQLIPITYEKARLLDRAARVRKSETIASSGEHRIAYLPFRRMKSGDLLELATDVYRASLDSEGLILDLRDNAGGRVADELLGLFCQPVHTFTEPRGGPRGYPTDRRVSPSWEGPMAVLCNGNTFSNAEIFCHAFKRLGRGKLIGMPTNGGVISAVGVTIPEVGELQIPFRGWFHVDTGQDLELNGAVPDVLVPLLPGAETEGKDPQLAEAIRQLEAEISARDEDKKAVIKHE